LHNSVVRFAASFPQVQTPAVICSLGKTVNYIQVPRLHLAANYVTASADNFSNYWRPRTKSFCTVALPKIKQT